MTDTTEAAGKVFAAYQQMCEDLASLASDFGRVIAERLEQFENAAEYSHSPNKLTAKPSHAWYWESRATDADGKVTEIRFAAALVILQSTRRAKLVGRAGRPELWFFAGSARGQDLGANAMSAQQVDTFLGPVLGGFDPPLHLGAPASRYVYSDEKERWLVSCLGVELGDVDTPEAIDGRVIAPLLAALDT